MRFGLACGGSLELVFERHENSAEFENIVAQLENRVRVSRILDLDSGASSLAIADRQDVFQFDGNKLVKVFGPSWRLLLTGAGQLSRFVAEFALALDYEVIVCEPREHFNRSWGLAQVPVDMGMPDDAVKTLASDRHSAVLALSHEVNLDDLAILQALESDVFYLGALGSKKNNEKRLRRLVSLGASEAGLARLHAPIGLAIGSHAPAEIAISILAEVTAVRNNASITRLS